MLVGHHPSTLAGVPALDLIGGSVGLVLVDRHELSGALTLRDSLASHTTGRDKPGGSLEVNAVTLVVAVILPIRGLRLHPRLGVVERNPQLLDEGADMGQGRELELPDGFGYGSSLRTWLLLRVPVRAAMRWPAASMWEHPTYWARLWGISHLLSLLYVALSDALTAIEP